MIRASATLCAAVIILGSVQASAATITGGNTVIARPNYDTFSNFSILDANNPISGSGRLTSWSIYAQGSTFPVQLLIYRAVGLGFDVVQSSAIETPLAAGVQTFALGPNFAVQAGDLVGFYSQTSGAVAFSQDGGPILFTNDNTGPGNNTNFVGSLSRTYSISVSGVVPEPTTWSMFLVGFGGMGAVLRSRRRAVT